MSEKNSIGKDFQEVPLRVSGFKRFNRVFFSRGLVTFGLVIIVAFIIITIFAPQLAPYDPNELDMGSTLLQPSWEHLLGTDALGRDTMSRIIFGARTSLIIVIMALCFGATVGNVLGLIAGYFGGITYAIIMRLIDALMAFPMILLALTVAALLGGGMRNVIVALSIGMLPPYARLMCGQVLTIKENDYITATRSFGASNLRIMLRHIVPNAFPPLIVLITMQVGHVILMEAGLSFLGVGIAPPAAAWGGMVSDGYQYLLKSPILSVAPGFAIMLVVFAFNMIGDGFRDAFDPRLRGKL
ncbi:MAG TPA: ABC transporter permease [Dehalococcoidales bacterium]|nr:ABC transporter permease [Dehalococcoidales bacterium]